MKVAVGRRAAKVTVGIRASKVTVTNSGSGGTDGDDDVEGLMDGETEDDKFSCFLLRSSSPY